MFWNKSQAQSIRVVHLNFSFFVMWLSILVTYELDHLEYCRQRVSSRKIQSSRLGQRAGSFQVVRAGIESFSVSEAVKAVNEDGYKVLDVRDKLQHDRARIVGSVHVPLFVENTDNDIGSWLPHRIFINVLACMRRMYLRVFVFSGTIIKRQAQ